MTFSRPVFELIEQRTSGRRYTGRLLESGVREKLKTCLQTLPNAPFAGNARFVLLEVFSGNDPQPRRLGTYGNVSGAVEFIAGAVKRAPYHLENYGYWLETLVLKATDLGLGTCWLGGTFDRSAFAAGLNLEAGEYLPAVTPVGYLTPTRNWRDQLLRYQAGSARRKPWQELFFNQTPGKELTREAAGDYARVLDMVRLGPSASNRQPWRIIREGAEPVFHFFLARNTLYTQAAKTFLRAEDIQRLDMGIALCHFELAARELQLPGAWRVLNPPLDFPKAEYLATWQGA